MKMDKKDKIDYIKNNFHQFYQIKLNKNIVTSDFVNLVMPIDNLSKINEKNNNYQFTHTRQFSVNNNVDSILKKYEDVSFDKEELIDVIGLKVIDGDTLDIGIPYFTSSNQNDIYIKTERVRLVGVNTPEKVNQTIYEGYESSKLFLEKLVYTDSFLQKVLDTEHYSWSEDNGKEVGRLYGPDEDGTNKYFKNNKKIKIKLDSKRRRDNYGRILAVLIIENKNINEIILKEGFGEIMYIPPSEFNPFDWSDINTPVSVYKFNNDTINMLSKYFNSDYSNIVFTPLDLDIIYPSQVYKGVIYVKLLPFSQNILMHLFPKVYDCSDEVLFLTDDMIERRTFSQSGDDYKFYQDRENINAYYQLNGKDRNRETSCSKTTYNSGNWVNNWCEFDYDISKDSGSYTNLQICAGYSYNNTSPYHALHYMGVKDNSNRPVEDRAFLVDVNTDLVKSKKNIITQMIPDEHSSSTLLDDTVSTPPHDNIKIYNAYDVDIDHTSIVHQTHHKIIKYIHDTLYSEEDMIVTKDEEGSIITPNPKKQYTSAEWVDILKDGYESHYNQ